MKAAGYLLTTKSGSTSGTAHSSTLDFWKVKDGDKINVMYTDEQVKMMLTEVALNSSKVYSHLHHIDRSVDEANEKAK